MRLDKHKIKARVTRAYRNKKRLDLADNEEYVTRTYQHHFVYPTISPDVIKTMLKGYGKTGFRLIPYPFGKDDYDMIIECKGAFDIPTITPVYGNPGFNYTVSIARLLRYMHASSSIQCMRLYAKISIPSLKISLMERWV